MCKIKVVGLKKSFDTYVALSDVTFELPQGTITGLIGKNGAGKTTLIKCLTLFYKDFKGDILIDEKPINKSLNQISYIPDIPVYYEELTLYEHLQFISSMYETKEEVDTLVDKLCLREYLDKFPQELSKGTLQRMMVILALLREYKVLIADEPFSGLDPSQILTLKNLFLELKDKGKTILISSHQLSIVQEICNRFVIIENGKSIYETNENALENETDDIESLYYNLLESEEVY